MASSQTSLPQPLVATTIGSYYFSYYLALTRLLNSELNPADEAGLPTVRCKLILTPAGLPVPRRCASAEFWTGRRCIKVMLTNLENNPMQSSPARRSWSTPHHRDTVEGCESRRGRNRWRMAAESVCVAGYPRSTNHEPLAATAAPPKLSTTSICVCPIHRRLSKRVREVRRSPLLLDRRTQRTRSPATGGFGMPCVGPAVRHSKSSSRSWR